MNCNRCNSELLDNDDVNSSRYKELGCLQCQVSIAAEHKYGDPPASEVETINCSRCGQVVSSPVPAGTIVRAFLECPECIAKIPEAVPLDGLPITEAEVLLILNRLSDLGAALLTEELLLAKRLIQHFHVCDFGYLLTELDDRQRRVK